MSFAFLFIKTKNGIGQYNLRIYGLTFVCSLASVIIFSEIPIEKSAAILSVFGTVLGYLFGISNEKNDINLKYLYYDYFEKDEDNIKDIKDKLIKEIKNNWNKRLNKFYDTAIIFSKIKN
jgi:hypothetical protein